MRRAARPLLYVGTFGVVLALGLVHAHFIGHYSFTGTSRFAWTVAYGAILCLTAYGFGLPDVPRTRKEALGPAVGAAFVGALVMSLVQLFIGDALLPRFVVFGSALLLPDWYRLCVGIAAGGRTRAEARDRVVVIAPNEEVVALEHDLHGSPERPASIAASCTVDEVAAPAAPSLLDRTGGEVPSVLVLSNEAQDAPPVVAQAADLHAQGVRVRSLTGFYEEWLGKLPVGELERASLLFDIGELHRAGYGRAKRIVDLGAALVGCLGLALLLPIVWLANLAGNRGPLLYRQRRVGKGGAEFTILKLRTMRPAAPDAATEWTGEDDPRITKFGRVLRKTHLDELPQVVNILRGDLSIVGPRPEQAGYVAELTDKLPFYPLRHLVRPGLTGWAQVKYGYAGSQSDALEKLQYEFWYLRHQSIRTDLRIMGRTVRSVLGGDQGQGR